MALTLADAFTVIVVVAFWVTAGFVAVVSMFWKWWRTPFGQSYVLKVLLLAGTLAPSAFHRMFGLSVTGIWFLWWININFGLIIPVIIWRGLILWREQRKGRSANPAIAIRDWVRARRAPILEPEEVKIG